MTCLRREGAHQNPVTQGGGLKFLSRSQFLVIFFMVYKLLRNNFMGVGGFDRNYEWSPRGWGRSKISKNRTRSLGT